MILTGTSSLSNSSSWHRLCDEEFDNEDVPVDIIDIIIIFQLENLVNHGIDVLLHQASSWTLHCLPSQRAALGKRVELYHVLGT